MIRLHDLPPELLRRVCEFALPQGLKFSFHRDAESDSSVPWSFHIAEGNGPAVDVTSYRAMLGKSRKSGLDTVRRCRNQDLIEEVQTALLYVNKVISAEARGKPRTTGITQAQSESNMLQLCCFAAIRSHSASVPKPIGLYLFDRHSFSGPSAKLTAFEPNLPQVSKSSLTKARTLRRGHLNVTALDCNTSSMCSKSTLRITTINRCSGDCISKFG